MIVDTLNSISVCRADTYYRERNFIAEARRRHPRFGQARSGIMTTQRTAVLQPCSNDARTGDAPSRTSPSSEALAAHSATQNIPSFAAKALRA